MTSQSLKLPFLLVTRAKGDTLIVLESDKASMEIPAPASGVVTALKVSEGQQVVQGDPIWR